MKPGLFVISAVAVVGLLAALIAILPSGGPENLDPLEKDSRENPIADALAAKAVSPQAEENTTESPAEDPPIDVEPADNSYCFVCHYNFDGEELALNHELQGIGCEDCHGESGEHSSDEDGLTAPDILYPKERINSACLDCHDEENLKEASGGCLFFAEVSPEKKYCTECHGKEHRIAVRTRRWDKETGKLLEDDGVRMMDNRDKKSVEE